MTSKDCNKQFNKSLQRQISDRVYENMKQKARMQSSFEVFLQDNLLNCGTNDCDWLHPVSSDMHWFKPFYKNYFLVLWLLVAIVIKHFI